MNSPVHIHRYICSHRCKSLESCSRTQQYEEKNHIQKM